MSEKRTVVVQALESKSGTSNGKPWTRYAIKDANGEIYSTFTQAAIDGVGAGDKVDIEFELNGTYKNLVSVQPHSDGSAVPETYAAKTQDGETDWDIIGLRKTRCLLWAEFLNGSLSAGIYGKASNAQGIDPRDAVIRAGVLFVSSAERDIFEREPGDDGIPFLASGEVPDAA